MSLAQQTVGILAYGSLIDDPGDELTPVIMEVIRDVTTPFPVEYGRTSSSRGGAPTLVPHPDGAAVCAAILVVTASIDDATNMLWRRETRTSDRTRRYPGARPDRPNAVKVESLTALAGIDVVLYTSIGANVAPLTADHLAELAVASVGKAELGKDGISYLSAAKANGIVTPLSLKYEEAILLITGTYNLADALASLRSDLSSTK